MLGPRLGPGDFCQVPRPDGWRAAAEQRRHPSPPGLDRRAVALGPDGSTVFAVETGRGRSELVRLATPGRPRRVIHTLDPTPSGRVAQYGSVRFDGRWLVYEVAHDAANPDDWEIHAWDSAADTRPFLFRRHDRTVPGPFLFVQAHGGRAAWTEGASRGGRTAVHVYDLAARADSVVRTGSLSPVFLAGDTLGWRSQTGPGRPPVVRAVSLRTGEPVRLPPVIAALRDTAHVAGDGRTWAWVSTDYQILYAWRPGWREPALVARAAEGEHIDQMELAGDLITWVGGRAVWAADLRGHSRTTLTPAYGGVVASGGSLLVTYAAAGPSKDPAQRGGTTSYVLRTPELAALPACPSWRAVPPPVRDPRDPAAEPGAATR
ncbi:hypothetical protein [Streptomyces sp. NPDC090025]|uniref:hypothetical protein n=1 Tax=Streptomyces sp. NPDC090025 TaxID=3365922 RepID=UPI003834A850